MITEDAYTRTQMIEYAREVVEECARIAERTSVVDSTWSHACGAVAKNIAEAAKEIEK